MLFDSVAAMILDMAEYKGTISHADNPTDLTIGFVGNDGYNSKEWRMRWIQLKCSPVKKYLDSPEKRSEFASKLNEIIQNESLLKKPEESPEILEIF